MVLIRSTKQQLSFEATDNLKVKLLVIVITYTIYKTRTNELLSFYRKPSVLKNLTGLIKTNTTLQEERLGLTNKNQSYPPTGTHPSPRSVLE